VAARRPRLSGAALPLLLLLLLAALVAATRIPLAPRYLFHFDNVNLALALDDFDPRKHQPQPPGYPLFVAQARLLRLLFLTPERTFLACNLLAGVAAPLLLFLLGARMYSRWAGVAAALLLALNPVFWRSTLTSPLRPYLAVITTLVAYLCYRAISRGGAGPAQDGAQQAPALQATPDTSARFAYYAAIALGLGAGWRPAQMVLLFPLWLLCAWCALRSMRRIALGMALAAAAVLTWLVPLAVASGGVASFGNMLASYLGEQAEGSSPVYGSGFWGWWKMITQAFVWHALAVVGWFWAALFVLWDRYFRRTEDQVGAGLRARPDVGADQCVRPAQGPASVIPNWLFLLAWVGPATTFFILIHVASPGHTLAVLPALCLLGGVYLERGACSVASFLPYNYAPRALFLAVALAVNAWFFLHPFRIPHERPHIRGGLPLVVEQFRFWGYFALRDASYISVRAENLTTGDRIRFLHSLGPPGQVVIVWQDDAVTWRKIAYYFSDYPVWVMGGIAGPEPSPMPRPWLWKGNRIISAPRGDSADPLRLPATGRVAWLLHLHSRFPAQLRAQGVPLQQFGTKYLTDLAAAPAQFRAGPFLFQKASTPP